jgi:pyruvate dehydrogenase E1 component
MYIEQEDVFYYLTVANEMYTHPPMPAGAEDGIVRGAYKLAAGDAPAAWPPGAEMDRRER